MASKQAATSAGTRPSGGSKIFWSSVVIFIAVPVVLCGGVGSWWLGRNSLAQSRLDDRLRDLQSEGLPVDNATLEVFYFKHTDDRNTQAWLNVQKAFSTPAVTNAAKNLPYVGIAEAPESREEPWADKEESEKFLAGLAPQLEIVHRIAASDQPVRFPVEFDSIMTLVPNVQEMRQVARVLMLQHRSALENRDGAGQTQCIQSLLGTSIALRGDPVMVSQLVSIAIYGMALGALKRSMQYGDLNDEQLTALQKRLKLFNDHVTPFRIAMAGERALALPLFQDPSIVKAEVGPIAGLGARPLDALAHLQLHEQFEQFEIDTLDKLVDAGNAFEQNLEKDFTEASWLNRFDKALTYSLTPAFSAYGNAIVRQVLQNRMALMSIALRRYQLHHGDFPKTLQALADSGIDITSLTWLHGDSFGYRYEDAGVTLWGSDPQSDESISTEPPDATSTDRGDLRYWIWSLDR